MADLKPVTDKQLISSLTSIVFKLETENHALDYYTINIFNSKFSISNNYQNKKFFHSEVLQNSILRINDKFNFLVTEHMGVIIPTKKSYIFFSDYSRKITFKSTDTRKEELGEKLRKYSKSIFFKKGGLFGMKNYYGDTLLKPLYDTLYVGQTHIVSVKDTKIKLFFNDGQPFKLKNIRVVADGYPGAQVLVKNKMYWLHFGSDSLYSKQPSKPAICGTSSYGPQMIVNKAEKFFSVPYAYDVEKNDMVLDVKSNELPIVSDIKVKDVKYINGSKQIESGFNDIYIIEYKDGTNSLLKKGFGNRKEVTLLPDNYSFRIDDGIEVFELRGKYGIFPVHSEVRYQSLFKFDGDFARFVLLDSKKGWVDKNGKEYLDQ